MLRYRMGAYAEALADFERLMSEFAGTVWAERAYFMRGWCYYQTGDTQQAVAIGRSFLAKHPDSTWTAEVSYWLAEHDFNTQSYGVAETNFAALAAFQSTNALADDALYWAGRSAFEQKAFRRAIDYFGQLIRLYTNSPLIPDSRFAQGDSLTEIGDFAGAILAYDEIIKKYPASPLYVRALGRIGDCQFTLGSDRLDRYQEAVASYRAALAHPQIAPALAVQAEYKLARTYERIGRTNEAVTHYLNVVYAWLAGRGEGIPMDEVWFVRAAFSAAALKEAASAWEDAAKIYQRVIDSGITAGGDATLRLERIAELKKAGSTTVSETRNMP
jgi:TolA-binding protein